MSNIRKAVNKKGMNRALQLIERRQKDEQKKYLTGIAGDRIIEHVPSLKQTPTEEVFKNENGAEIVLGRDRPSDIESGYGGKGYTQCGSIDLVVGRKGASEEERLEESADPDFKKDAARIYISQKTDIDDNFDLAKGYVGTAVGKSGIGIKADGVRIIAREGVKIISGADDVNSQGAKNNQRFGVDLIANNDDSDLQPIVKGKNLAEALQKLTDHVDQLAGIVESFVRMQTQINTSLAAHTHVASGFGAPTSPSPDLAPVAILGLLQTMTMIYPSIINNKLNAAIHKMQYYKPMSDKYINSKNNRTS